MTCESIAIQAHCIKQRYGGSRPDVDVENTPTDGDFKDFVQNNNVVDKGRDDEGMINKVNFKDKIPSIVRLEYEQKREKKKKSP